jgi:glucose/arabinose dehydrogenase
MTPNQKKEKPMYRKISRRRAIKSVAIALSFLASSLAVAQSDNGYKLETVAENLSYPWSLAFLPDGQFLVTQRTGELIRVSPDGKSQTPISGVPDTYVASQGGFFDVVLHPDFKSNKMVYLSYAHGSPDANGTGVVRAVLEGDKLTQSKLILLVESVKDTPVHYGGRLLFLPDGTLLVTTGDGFDYREMAQDIDSELGKVLRITDDGSPASDNPYADSGNLRIWTYGHRNPQGLTINGDNGEIYLHEHGPKGGDELNLLQAGKNYGWPAITKGIDYSGAVISPYTELSGMEQAQWYWVPSIAPSGLAWYGGDAFPEWRGDLFVGALVNKDVHRLDMEDGKIVAEESLFGELDERIRDVRAGPDGFLYLLTDSEKGKLIRVRP